MTRLPILCLLAVFGGLLVGLPACTPDDADAVSAHATYGAPVDAGDAVPASAVASEPARYVGRTLTLDGRISQVCQKKGCWLALDAAPHPPIRVLVPRTSEGAYAFTVPTDAAGVAAVTGTLHVDSLDVAARQHLRDDGAATPRRVELRLQASGVQIAPFRTEDA